MPEPLSIVVDENVPYSLESFGRLGRVHVRPGRSISAADVRAADVLIVRSVTRVDESLLAGSGVRFVGTATIGCDHVDVDYLAARGIAFVSAPGSNANSVAEYVTAALLESAAARGASLEGATLAVIGVGNVGSRVAEKARALRMRLLLNDPPRQAREESAGFVPLDRALGEADYVTLHVPLERGGPHRTVDMAGEPFFSAMRRGVVFVNTSRGAVVQEPALARALDDGRVAHAVLDVFGREPAIDPEIVRRAFLATPHIAGYSFDGKVAATMMLYEALCRWLGVPAALDLAGALPASEAPRVDVAGRHEPDEELLREIVAAVYDIREDDRALRAAVGAEDRAARFDLLRKNYRRRREFPYTTVVADARRESLLAGAAGLGFRVERR